MKEILDLHAIDFTRPVPIELIGCLEHGEFGLADAAQQRRLQIIHILRLLPKLPAWMHAHEPLCELQEIITVEFEPLADELTEPT